MRFRTVVAAIMLASGLIASVEAKPKATKHPAPRVTVRKARLARTNRPHRIPSRKVKPQKPRKFKA